MKRATRLALALAVTLGEWVLAKAAEQAMDWASAGLALPISVNLFARHLEHPAFIERLRALLTDNPSLATGWLRLELLETASIHDLSGIAATIEECRRMGVEFALDDFGTGYSSLAYLKRFPIDTIKIDRAFIKDLASESEQAAIAIAIIAMAHGLKLRVLAEGVETQPQLDILREQGCDAIQGYFFSHPLPADRVEQLIRDLRAKSDHGQRAA